MEYLIITNQNTRRPEIQTDSHGFALNFTTYKSAKEYIEKYDIERATIVAVCDDQRNYLV